MERKVLPIVPPLNTEAYLNYEELTAYLNSIAEAVPQLVRIFSLGNTVSGRALWAAEVTNTNTGAASSKPAIWIDGNIHGAQLSGSTACLAILQRLSSEHGRSPSITELLDNNTFYIVPRLAPDGAELCITSGLSTSAGRRLGFLDGLREGLVPGDVNGDGRILQMRVPDPYGQWKVSKRDERLLIPRLPGDNGETYYRLYREGLLDREDRGPIHLRLINSKRELSHDFTQDSGIVDHHYGGNGFVGPFSQIESRLVSAFMHSLGNLCLAISFRSGAGTIQITSSPEVHRRDQALMKILADKASELTNLPVEEVGEASDFADWVYQELGVPCLRIDGWNLLREAGVENSADKSQEHALSAVLRWLDYNNGGKGFVKWEACEHPQLGAIEVGGWDTSVSWSNPPVGEILSTICESEVNVALCLASVVPKIGLGECRDEIVGWAESENGEDGELLPLRIISVEIRNEGYLPTWLTEELRSKDEPIISEISIPEKAELLIGHSLSEHNQLSGVVSLHLRQNLNAPFFSGSSETERCVKTWLVRGSGEVVVSAAHPRGGVVQFISDGSKNALRQRFKVSKPSAIIPATSPVPYVVAVTSAALAAAIPTQIANMAGQTASPETNSSPKPPSLPRASFKVPSTKSNLGRSSIEPTPVGQISSVTTEAAAVPQVRPVKLTESAPAPEVKTETPPSQPSVRGGYKPMVFGGGAVKRPSAVEKAASSDSVSQPGASEFTRMGTTGAFSAGSLRKVGTEPTVSGRYVSSEESPLRKDPSRHRVQPSGRVFGQPPAKAGVAAAVRPSESVSRPAPARMGRSSEDSAPAAERRTEVKPHPLLPSKGPRPVAPNPEISQTQIKKEDFQEDPLAPTAPLLLRRSRGDD
ncbi:MAG: M14 family zinc carboxypeptidase [Candidatus Bruticola sp.]